MNSLNKSIRVLLVIIAIQGCSTPYYGHSKKDWEKLSEEERNAIKKEYEFILDTKKEQAHEDKIDARTQSIIDLGVKGKKY